MNEQPEWTAKAWGAPCDDCGTLTVVDGDGKNLPEPGEWDRFPNCYVCGSTLFFDEQSETMWDRESRLMVGAAKRAAASALRTAADDAYWYDDTGAPNKDAAWLRLRADEIEAAS